MFLGGRYRIKAATSDLLKASKLEPSTFTSTMVLNTMFYLFSFKLIVFGAKYFMDLVVASPGEFSSDFLFFYDTSI